MQIDNRHKAADEDNGNIFEKELWYRKELHYMNVELAKTAGFCFGVKRAVDTVYKQIEKHQSEKIFTYGPIIHNEEVIKDLRSHGVEVLNDEEELKTVDADVVVIRSHGVAKYIYDIMDERGIHMCRCDLSFCEENS